MGQLQAWTPSRAAFWAAAALLAVLGTACLVESFSKLGRPFPGFRLLGDQCIDLNLPTSWTGSRAGLRPTDRILTVDGSTLAEGGAVYAYAGETAAGTVIRYEIDRVDIADRHTRLVVDVPTQRLGLADWLLSAFLFWLSGAVYLVLGAVVSLLRPGDATARAHLVFSWIAAFCYFTAFTPNTALGLPFWAGGPAALATSASAVNLAFKLPRRVGGRRLPWIQTANALAWGILAALFLWCLAADRFRFLSHFGTYGLPLLAILALGANPAWTLRSRTSNETERAQARIVLWGIGLLLGGALVLVFGSLADLPAILWLPATILMLALPVAIASAIVYQRLFAIDVPFRRSVTYALALLLLTLFYVGVVGISGSLGGASGASELVGALAVAAVFAPLRDRIQVWLDAAFFRIAYDPIRILLRFADLSRAATEPRQLLRGLQGLVEESLAPEWIRFEGLSGDLDHDSGSGPPRIEADGVALRLPVPAERTSLGALALGPKKSGLPYSEPDRHLLASLCDRLALWLDLYRRIDADRRKEAELAGAQRSEALQRQFLRLVSHELRTPISTILLTSEALAKKGDATPISGGIAEVERIQRSASGLTRLVEDLLDAAQIEAGIFELRREDVAFTGLAAEAVAEMEPHARARGQALRLEVSAPGLRVAGDRLRLLQVFRNLLHNAIKFTPEEGTILIRIASDEASALCEVLDSGPGLLEEEIGQVFERDARAGSSRGVGSGLGLFIARELVHAHGGSIGATSENGNGCKFWFRIRLIEPETFSV